MVPADFGDRGAAAKSTCGHVTSRWGQACGNSRVEFAQTRYATTCPHCWGGNAEALTEYIHKQVRVEMGIAGEDAAKYARSSKRATAEAATLGTRLPDLSQQQKLWPLLQPERIGVASARSSCSTRAVHSAVIAHPPGATSRRDNICLSSPCVINHRPPERRGLRRGLAPRSFVSRGAPDPRVARCAIFVSAVRRSCVARWQILCVASARSFLSLGAPPGQSNGATGVHPVARSVFKLLEDSRYCLISAGLARACGSPRFSRVRRLGHDLRQQPVAVALDHGQRRGPGSPAWPPPGLLGQRVLPAAATARSALQPPRVVCTAHPGRSCRRGVVSPGGSPRSAVVLARSAPAPASVSSRVLARGKLDRLLGRGNATEGG